MTAETVSYGLVALALILGALTILLFATLGRLNRRSGDRRVAPIGNPEYQLAFSTMLVGIVFLLGLAYIVREPSRMAQASHRQTDVSIEKGIKTYVSLCVSCHGPHGEGGVGKPLNTAQFRPDTSQEMDKVHELLRKTISRGRPGTAMPAWAQDEGGPLNSEQVNQVIVLIQQGDWEEVAEMAAKAPPQPVPAPGSTGASVPGAPPAGAGDLAGEGRHIYAAKGCSACHGTSLQGGVGPNLQHVASAPKIAGTLPPGAESLKKWISDPAGVKPGTAMPKLGLTERELEAIVSYLMQQK